ncbi:MAG: ParB/RepB/Spo0J family partition protein [Candidatus Riflebacteria bacterium]|nr:ParB/RepB/Spo0J family partition protein [Candidatus Riflebacteria bacterium]
MMRQSADITNDGIEEDEPRPGEEVGSFELVPLSRIKANPNQPRKVFDKQSIEELAQSIRANGVLQPILVRRRGEIYEIISGERRYRAAQVARIRRIPAYVRNMDERETQLASLIENIQRENLNPVEEAEALREILLNHGMTHEKLAETLGRSRSALTNRLRILQLSKEVQSLIAEGRISAGHAKMLAGLQNSQQVKLWVKRILKESLSVYDTEKEIARARDQEKKGRGERGKTDVPGDIHIRQVEEHLMELLGAKVRIRQGRSKGSIEIEFYNREDLERVVDNMAMLRS